MASLFNPLNIKIDKHVPPPTHRGAEAKSETQEFLKSLTPGDSFILPNDLNLWTLRGAARVLKYSICIKKVEENGVSAHRCWLIAKEPNLSPCRAKVKYGQGKNLTCLKNNSAESASEKTVERTTPTNSNSTASSRKGIDTTK